MKASNTMKKCVSILIMISLLFMMDKVVYATSLEPNNPISVSNLSIKSSTDPLNEVTILVPTQSYKLHFTVSDSDNLDNVYFEVLLHQGEYNPETILGVNQNGSEFGLYWNTGLQSEPQVVYDENTSNLNSTWVLVSSNVSQFENGLNTYEFEIEFKVSKVALASNNWGLTVRVMDDYRDEAIGALAPTNDIESISGLGVAWYGEIQLSSETMSWGNISYETTYSSLSSLANCSVNVISNGTYDLSSKSSESWVGNTKLDQLTNDLQATLVSDSRLESNTDQTFSLRLNDENSYNLSSAIQLSSSYSMFALDGSKTTEGGSSVQLYVYIQLSQKFRNGLYWGSISIGISNSLD